MTTLVLAEKLILESFCKEPFHSLFYYYKLKQSDICNEGGTCSDKVLLVRTKLRKEGFDVKLHSSFINGKECHRLLNIKIDNKIYFADVGNAWPSYKLFSANEVTNYKCFGINFRTNVSPDQITISQKRHDFKGETVCIPIESKPENRILNDIKVRFESTEDFPFADKFRFAQIIGSEFLFIRDNELHRYSNSGYSKEPVFNHQEILLKLFGFDLSAFLKTYG